MKRKHIAGIVTLAIICVVLCVVGFVKWSVSKVLDRDVHSRNIETPSHDPSYPYVGIWKREPENQYGVIIEKAGDDMYSVSFFGPGGRFKPGKWTPNTKITGDPKYRIIDKDTIDIGPNTYHRMPNSEGG